MRNLRAMSLASIGLAVVLALAARAQAELIEFTFEGELFEVNGMPPAPWEGVEVGSTFSVRYIFDSEQEDQASTPLLGIYDMESIWVGLDGVELEATPVDISVYDDVWPWDEYHASFEGLPAESNGGILLAGFGAFESDELPLDLDLDAFHLDRLFRMVGVGYQTYGSVSSFESRIVPAPSGAVVLVVLGGLIRRRRRHSH